MKKLMIIIFCLTMFSSYGQDKSDWQLHEDNVLSLNYQTFGQSYVRGAGIGLLGYGLGMYVSGNRTVWGVVGSMVAVNLPLILDKDYSNPEKAIGYNLGAMSVSFSLTFAINLHRKEDKPMFKIVRFLRKRN